MPSVTACIWNIQNYGTLDSDKSGENSSLRNRFIRDFVRQRGIIDLLFIQEVSLWALGSLQNLVRTLNEGLAGNDKDWAFSWCGSAITSTANNPLQNAIDVTFLSGARSEGYAVVWRTNRASFHLLPSLVNLAKGTWNEADNPSPPAASPLNLITLGRPADNVQVGVPAGGRKKRVKTEFRALGGYLPAHLMPYSDDVLMAAWPDLSFPTTSIGDFANISWRRTRHPAFVVADLQNGEVGTGQRLCPIAAYHAPSNQARASWGAFMSGLSRELYVTNDLGGGGAPDPAALVHNDNVVMGGDYNWSVDQADWPGDYHYYTSAYNQAPAGGANCGELPAHTLADADRRTTVQLLQGEQHNQVIVSVNANDYLRHKIDLLFSRGFVKGANSGRPSLLQELLNDGGGAIYGDTLTEYYYHLNGVIARLAGANQRFTQHGAGPERRVWDPDQHAYVWRPMICGAWGGTFQDWDVFIDMLRARQLTAARQAAEFCHIFISDHLPLVVEIPV